MQPKSWAGVVGADVRSSDGVVIGRVTAVHVVRGSDEPLLVQVYAGKGETDIVVPFANALIEDGVLAVPYGRAKIEAGPTMAPNATLSTGETASVLNYYHAGTVDMGGAALTDRATAIGDVAAEDPDVRPLPPIVVIQPGFDGGDRDGAV